MSDMSNGNRDERGRALLSLASWMEPEAESRRPEPQMSPLLAGLARFPTPDAPDPAPEMRRSEPSQPSIADLLRRRSKVLARQPSDWPTDDLVPASPEIQHAELPRSRRLDLQRAGREKAAPRRDGEKVSARQSPADKPEAALVSRDSRMGGVIGAIAGLMRRPGKASPAAADGDPQAPRRSAKLRLPRRAHEAAESNAPAVERPPAARPLVRRNPAPPAMQPAASHEAPRPVPAHPHAHYAPPAPGYVQMPAPVMPMAAAPVFYPSVPATMVQPASAHFYWPQPVLPPHPAFVTPLHPTPWQQPASFPAAPAWPLPAAPAPYAAPPQVSVPEPPIRPGAANDSPSYPVHTAPDPLTSEIDEVRERLRSFGESLRELHRMRSARQIG